MNPHKVIFLPIDKILRKISANQQAPDQSTVHSALAYRRAECLVNVSSETECKAYAKTAMMLQARLVAAELNN